MGDKQRSWLFPDIKTFREKKNLYLSLAVGIGVMAWFAGYSRGYSIQSQIGGFLCVTQVLVSGIMFILYYNPIGDLEE